jgi:tetratricopeptide (TPR) repeat protein
MKMKHMKKIIFCSMFLAASLFSVGAMAQCKTPVWPADKAKAEECLAIYGDAFKAGNMKEAKGPMLWLIRNAPQVNRQIYIDAAEMYDKAASAETDPAKKQILIDSMLIMYDLRIANCQEDAQVLNRKANASFKHNYKNKDKLPGLLELFDKVFEMNGNNVTDATLPTYMNLTDLNAKYVKNLSCDQVMQRYDKLMSIIDAKTKLALEKNKPADVEKLKGYKTQIEDTMIKSVTSLGCATCDFVKKNMEPKYRQNPKEPGMAKKMFGFMLADKCTDDPLWLELGDALIDGGEKDFGLMKNVAIKHIGKGNMERAEALIREASTLAKEPADKSEALMILGNMESKKGNKNGARDLFRQANAADPKNLEALSKIGDLYFNSFDDCKKLKSKAEDRLVYLAAFDMYMKAKDNQGMAKAKSQFPGKEEIFELNWKAGETKAIDGCWVGGSVVLRTRD